MDQNKIEEMHERYKKHKFLDYIGARLDKLEDGKATILIDKKEEITQGLGYLHGGLLATITDSVGCNAAATTLEKGVHVLTVDLKINYLNPANGDRFIAIGEVVKSGKTICVSKTEIRDLDTNELLCVGLVTMKPTKYK